MHTYYVCTYTYVCESILNTLLNALVCYDNSHLISFSGTSSLTRSSQCLPMFPTWSALETMSETGLTPSMHTCRTTIIIIIPCPFISRFPPSLLPSRPNLLLPLPSLLLSLPHTVGDTTPLTQVGSVECLMRGGSPCPDLLWTRRGEIFPHLHTLYNTFTCLPLKWQFYKAMVSIGCLSVCLSVCLS